MEKGQLQGVKAEQVIMVFLLLRGVLLEGGGNHANIVMPNDAIITIPAQSELKEGLLRAALNKAGIREEDF